MAQEPRGSSKVPWELIPTGIEGLDKLLQGGIPRGAVLLLAGNPGTGKTTLAAKILYEILRRGEPGIYVSFVEPYEDFRRHMLSLGVDFQEYLEKGLFDFMEALIVLDEETMAKQMEELLLKVIEKRVKAVVIDSVTAMLQIVKDVSKVRELLQNFFVRGVKPQGAITVLIAEHPYGARMVGYGIEEFIVDAVFVLRMYMEQGKLARVLELRKVRWAPLRQAEVPFYIRPGRVIEVRLPEPLEEVPALDTSMVYSLAEAYSRLVNAGIVNVAGRVDKEWLDAILAVPRGGQVVVGVAPDVSTRLLLALTIAGFLAAYPGAKISVLTTKSSPESIRRLVSCVLAAIGSEPSLAKRVRVVSANPTAFTLFELTDLARSHIDEHHPDLLFMEGIEVVERLHDAASFTVHLYNIMLRNKRNRVTSFYIYGGATRNVILSSLIAYMADMGVIVTSAPLELDGLARWRRRLNVEVYASLGHGNVELVIDTRRIARLLCVA